jgi:arylsulfate sulfotransferase
MRRFPFLALSALALLASPLYAVVRIQQFVPSLSSPQPVGTTITWTVAAKDTNPGPLTYRFSVGYRGQTSHVVRDFALPNSFQWTPYLTEGIYTIEVIARDLASGETATSSVNFTVNSRVVGGQAAVTAMPNPLVALFSAPPCPAGDYISVFFYPKNTLKISQTGWVNCSGILSSNIFIAGMLADTTYLMNYVIESGGAVAGAGPAILSFTTGTPTETFTPTQVLQPELSQADPSERVVLHSYFLTTFPFATDLAGNVVWYYKQLADAGKDVLLTRPLYGGNMFMIATGEGSNAAPLENQLIRSIDLAGDTIRETNAGRISEQLVAMGADPINSFSHEVQILPNGDTMVIGVTEKIFPAGTQGSTAPVDILGDMIMILDANWQVKWFWDSYDYLDINRAAVLGETCAPAQAGCPPVLLAPIANDWLHGNGLYYIPSDGDLLYSSRHQDWLIKIDYNNGNGTKNILWRMGVDGDFAINSSDPYPWFSHQHNASFENEGTTVLTVYDDGNTRVSPPPIGLGSGNSRGQELMVDETNMVVTPSLNADLGVYSYALGSAQLLPNGNHMFQAGLTSGGGSETIEVTPSGSEVYNIAGTVSYRAWLMPDMYHPPSN